MPLKKVNKDIIGDIEKTSEKAEELCIEDIESVELIKNEIEIEREISNIRNHGEINPSPEIEDEGRVTPEIVELCDEGRVVYSPTLDSVHHSIQRDEEIILESPKTKRVFRKGKKKNNEY